MQEIIEQFGTYQIRFINDEQYTLNSKDNIFAYDHVYYEDNKAHPVSKHGIIVSKADVIISSAITLGFAGATVIHKASFVIEEKRMLLCISNRVICLTLPNLELIWTNELDWATCFEIYPWKSDYIVHGEISITRIDPNGKPRWSFSGPDIFTGAFTISNDIIMAVDFNNVIFKLNIETGKEF